MIEIIRPAFAFSPMQLLGVLRGRIGCLRRLAKPSRIPYTSAPNQRRSTVADDFQQDPQGGIP